MSDRPDIIAGPPLSVIDATAHVVAEQARQLRRNGRKAGRGGDGEAVHDMRVAVRRLRSALRAVDEHVAAPRAVRRGLRRIAKRLGRVRDQDVMIELLASLPLPAAGDAERGRLERLVQRLRRRRARTQRDLRRALQRRRYRKLLHRLDDVAEEPRARHSGFTLASRVLAETSESLGEAVAASAGMRATDPDPAALHALRIGFKRLRYALDFHASACGLAYDVERRMAHEMQDVLGAIHDRDLLLAWLAAGRKPFAGPWPALTARLGVERMRLRRRFRRLRAEWTRRTRPEPHVAPLEPPRFVNLEVQRVGLRLVTGVRSA